jgi:hypothetical protein
MKKLFLLLSFLTTIFVTSTAQLPSYPVRVIKIGNSYREANQYKEAERMLISGLASVRQQKDKYWEAVACENLGLLFRDMEDSIQAIRYLDTAGKLYRQLNLEGSHIAMMQLAEGIRKRADSYAGIDIGSTGVKLSIVQVTLGREGNYVYNIIKDSAINSNFADLNITSFEGTKKAIQQYFTMLSNRKVNESNIFIAFSSGVLQAVKAKRMSTDSISRVFETVARSVMPSYTRPINFLDADAEAKYTNLGIVLPRFKSKSVSIDIGGGNTKGGYYNAAGVFESFSLPYGSRFMTVSNTDNNLPENIKSELKMFNQRPGIQTKKEVFFLGGIVWAMINLLYPEKANADYIEFTINDVETFKKLATSDYTQLIQFTEEKIERIMDAETQQKARKNFENVQNTFTPDNLRRGAILISGIMNELNVPTLKKRYYFLSKGSHIAWVTGYVVENISEKYRTAKE